MACKYYIGPQEYSEKELKEHLADGALDTFVSDGDLDLTRIKKEGAAPPKPPSKPPSQTGAGKEGPEGQRDKEDAVVRKILQKRVMAENYPTLFKENIVRTQITAETQGEYQQREVPGDYVVALEKDLRGVSVRNAMDLKALLGEDWDLKTLDYIERSLAAEEQPGNPAQVIGILNIISTKNYQEIKETHTSEQLAKLITTQMRIDKAALEVSRDASLTLNMRRLYQKYAQGGSMSEELAQEMVLTKDQLKFRDELSNILNQQPTDEELNTATQPIEPKEKKPPSEPKKKSDNKAAKEQIILEGTKAAQKKSFRDYIADAKEKLKNLKC